MIMIRYGDVTAERRHYKTHCPLKGSLCIASIGGAPIGGQDRDGESYRCSAPYTLSRFAGLPLKGKREIWREKQGVIYFMYHSGVSPFGGERSEPISRMLITPYDTDSQSRNADFISIAAERQSATLGLKGRQT